MPCREHTEQTVTLEESEGADQNQTRLSNGTAEDSTSNNDTDILSLSTNNDTAADSNPTKNGLKK